MSRDASPERKKMSPDASPECKKEFNLEEQIVGWFGERFRKPIVRDWTGGCPIAWNRIWAHRVVGMASREKVRAICPEGTASYPVVIVAILEHIYRHQPYGSYELQLLLSPLLSLCPNQALYLCELMKTLPLLVDAIDPDMLTMTFWSCFKLALVFSAQWAEYMDGDQKPAGFELLYQNLKTDSPIRFLGYLPPFPSTKLNVQKLQETIVHTKMRQARNSSSPDFAVQQSYIEATIEQFLEPLFSAGKASVLRLENHPELKDLVFE